MATTKEQLFHVKRTYHKGMTLDDIEGIQEQATVYVTVVPKTVTEDDIDNLSLLEYMTLPDELKGLSKPLETDTMVDEMKQWMNT